MSPNIFVVGVTWVNVSVYPSNKYETLFPVYLFF